MTYSERGGIEDFSGGKAKLLLGGPPKAGKTWAAVLTSPRPVFVLNADGGGLASISKQVKFDGKDFDGEDVFNERDLDTAIAKLRKEPKRYRTIVLDSATLLSKHLELEFRHKNADKRAAFGQLQDAMLSSIGALIQLPCHVVITAHFLDAGAGAEAGSLGTLPAMSGSSKVYIPALLQDWTWLDVTPSKVAGEQAKREFLVGAQGNWIHGCRSIQSTGRIEASVTAFIKKAGLRP